MRSYRPVWFASRLLFAALLAAFAIALTIPGADAARFGGGSFSASRMNSPPVGARPGVNRMHSMRTVTNRSMRTTRMGSTRLMRTGRYINKGGRRAASVKKPGNKVASATSTGTRNPKNPRDPKYPGNSDGARNPKPPQSGDGGRYPGGDRRPDRPGRFPLPPVVGGFDPVIPPVVGGGTPGVPGVGGGSGSNNTAVSSLGGRPPSAPSGGGAGGPQGPRPGAINIPPQDENRFVSNEVLVQFVTSMTTQQMTAFAARHRLQTIEVLRLSLTNTVILRGRITDGRPVRVVLGSMSSDPALIGGTMISAQPQYLYRTLQATTVETSAPLFTPPAGATPQPTPVMAAVGAPVSAMRAAQYMLAKLQLPQARQFARGTDVLVAVIDSGIDLAHPEIAGVVAGSYDALGTRDKPHFHGTAIAGAIAAHSQLEGVAPAARLLAIRAFGANGTSAEATTTAILKGIDHAVQQNARVINMSFAGPADPGVSQQLERANARGVVLVAASGNYGPDSPPQYPAADPNVIAVSATDASDNLFAGSNRGNHIAIAAPGVDILLPDPGNGYQLRTGTSFAAAHVSGIVALILERKPSLSPQAVRDILTSTAKDLGAPGKDPQFGAGLADAYQALISIQSQVVTAPVTPVALPDAAR